MERATLKQRNSLLYLKRRTMQLTPETLKRIKNLKLYSRAESAAKSDIETAKSIEKRLHSLLDTVSANSLKDFQEWTQARQEIKLYVTAGINSCRSRSLNHFVLACVGAYDLKGSPKRWRDLDTTGLSQEELRALLFVVSETLVEKQKKIHLFRRALTVGTVSALVLTLLGVLLSLTPIWPF